jgi:hypothetical protein
MSTIATSGRRLAVAPETAIASAGATVVLAREVLVRGAAEVLVDRVLADDQRLEALTSVGRLDGLDDGLHVAPELHEEQRAVAVARHGSVPDLRRARGAQLCGERLQPRLEARIVSGELRGRHDHRLVDLEALVRTGGRERVLEHLLRPLGLGPAGEVVVVGQRVAEQPGDGHGRQQHDHHPRADHRPAVPGADPRQPLRGVPDSHGFLRSRGSHRRRNGPARPPMPPDGQRDSWTTG